MTYRKTRLSLALTIVAAVASMSSLVVFLGGSAVHAAESKNTSPPHGLTAAEKAAGWRLLFDGQGLRGWHNVGSTSVDPHWTVVDGEISLMAGGGSDIVTDEQFADFEMLIEWSIAPGGNSGIFYRVPDGNSSVIWHDAVEYQVLDDLHAEDRQLPSHRAGSAYDLYAPPASVVRPVGEFNQTRIVAQGTRIEHWLNGVKVVTFDTASDDWKTRFAASKFAKYPDFAAAKRGRIGLQNHGDAVRYRNIRIRPL